MDYKNYYDEKYVKKYASKEGEGRIENIIKSLDLTKDIKVLDVGCGNGFLANLIADNVKAYIGIDVSSEFISDAKKRVSKDNCKFYKIELEEYAKGKTNIYDLIFLLDVTEHIPDYDLKPILRDCQKLLKSNGMLVIHTPNKDYLLEQLKGKGLIKQTTGHIAVRNSEEYINLLKGQKFGKIILKRTNHYNKLLNKLYFLSIIPGIGKYFVPRLLIFAQKR